MHGACSRTRRGGRSGRLRAPARRRERRGGEGRPPRGTSSSRRAQREPEGGGQKDRHLRARNRSGGAEVPPATTGGDPAAGELFGPGSEGAGRRNVAEESGRGRGSVARPFLPDQEEDGH